VQQKLIDLGRELRNLQSRASEIERKVLDHIESQIRELDEKINRTQVLDLIPAIVGLGISAVGTLLGLGS
jgi:transcription elongation GreA/GreB family factor